MRSDILLKLALAALFSSVVAGSVDSLPRNEPSQNNERSLLDKLCKEDAKAQPGVVTAPPQTLTVTETVTQTVSDCTSALNVGTAAAVGISTVTGPLGVNTVTLAPSSSSVSATALPGDANGTNTTMSNATIVSNSTSIAPPTYISLNSTASTQNDTLISSNSTSSSLDYTNVTSTSNNSDVGSGEGIVKARGRFQRSPVLK